MHVLNYPKHHEAWFDIITNELDGDWYEERNPPINLARNIDIPVYLQIDQGRGWTMDGTIELFHALQGPKKLDIGPYPPMQSRPFIEEHDKMFRWYDHWIKGIDNGIMDEPAVNVFVEGARQRVTADQWPPRRTSSTGRCTCGHAANCPPNPNRWAHNTPPPRTASTRRRSRSPTRSRS